MNIIVYLLALVAVSLGFRLNHRRIPMLSRRTQLSGSGDMPFDDDDVSGSGLAMTSDDEDFIEVLKTVADKRKNTNIPNGQQGKPSKPKNTVSYMKSLFTFPGAYFVNDVFKSILDEPLPKDPTFLGATYEPNVDDLKDTMLDVYEEFGEWTGITTLFTMKMTEWYTENMFTCPSMIMDKIFFNWIREKLTDKYSSLMGDVYNSFSSAALEFFPDSDDAWRQEMATDGTMRVVSAIGDILVDIFFSHALKDIAKFSYTFYGNLLSAVELYDGGDFPEDVMVTPQVECFTQSQMMQNFKTGMAMMANKIKHQGEEKWIINVEQFFMDKLPKDQRKSFTFNENTLKKVAAVINNYAQEILLLFDQYEEIVESTSKLELFLADYLGEDYSTFIKALVMQLMG